MWICVVYNLTLSKMVSQETRADTLTGILVKTQRPLRPLLWPGQRIIRKTKDSFICQTTYFFSLGKGVNLWSLIISGDNSKPALWHPVSGACMVCQAPKHEPHTVFTLTDKIIAKILLSHKVGDLTWKPAQSTLCLHGKSFPLIVIWLSTHILVCQ